MKIVRTPKFKHQLKKLVKKHYPVEVLVPCLEAIINKDEKILKKIKDHKLTGAWKNYREFHPARYASFGKKLDSWIVIYEIRKEEVILVLVTTGDHEILNK